MQGQAELFFAVQEVIREECYMSGALGALVSNLGFGQILNSE